MNPDPSPSVPTSPLSWHLLDVNVLLAAIWANHPQHAKAFAWLSGKSVILCPLSELGFLRISTNKKVINAPMAKARELLNQFATDRKAARIAADLQALDSHPGKSEQVTDHYLADLAASHGIRLATLDQNLSHSCVDVIP
jgi:toxin-antitoxin system PIN domain toxin